LVDLFECMMMHGLANPKQNIILLFSFSQHRSTVRLQY